MMRTTPTPTLQLASAMTRTPLTTCRQHDRGSLPLALLAVFLIGALATTLVAGAISGTRFSTFDAAYEQAGQAADVGVQSALYHIQAQATGYVPGRIELSGGAGDMAWETVAERVDDREWRITSSGGEAGDGRNEVTRTMEVFVSESSLFTLAAFGRNFVDFNGGNGAGSYRSGDFTAGGFIIDEDGSDIDDDGIPVTQTGNGVVATNGALFLKGSNTYNAADRIEVHNAREKVLDPLPTATGYVQGSNHVSADASGKVFHFREPIELDPSIAEPPYAPTSAFPAVNPTLCPSTPTEPCNVVPPGISVFTDVLFDEDTVFLGNPNDPSIIYFTGRIVVPNANLVNFRVNDAGELVPNPTAGLLMFTSVNNIVLDMGNHSGLSGALYAPNGGFAGGAQSNFYGSLIMGSINNVGGVNFHYDDALADMTLSSSLTVDAYTEP